MSRPGSSNSVGGANQDRNRNPKARIVAGLNVEPFGGADHGFRSAYSAVLIESTMTRCQKFRYSNRLDDVSTHYNFLALTANSRDAKLARSTVHYHCHGYGWGQFWHLHKTLFFRDTLSDSNTSPDAFRNNPRSHQMICYIVGDKC